MRAQARKALPEGSFLLSARLSVTIYLFPQTLMQGDIDNRAKLILDAMNRTVYEDDRSIYRLVIEKFDVDRPYAVPSQVSDVLGEALAAQGPIVYINVQILIGATEAMSVHSFEIDRGVFDRIEAELAPRGYHLIREPQGERVPAFLRGFRPDAIALGSEPSLVIEVLAGRNPNTDRKIRAIRDALAGQSGWDLKIYYAASEQPRMMRMEQDILSEQIERVERLIEIDLNASFLMAWAIVEAAVRSVDPGVGSQPMTTRSVANTLVSQGIISQDQGDRLFHLAHLRNQVAHGQLDLTANAEDVRAVLDAARAVLNAAD